MKKYLIGYLFAACQVLLVFCTTSAATQDGVIDKNIQPLTVAEKSDFQATSTSAEVEEFVDFCVDKGWHLSKFVFGKTVEGRDLYGVQINLDYYKLGDQDERNVILMVGNIHSGECAGKEGMLMLIRDLMNDPQSAWLEENILLLVPNYSADSNDRFGLQNRPGQIGPVQGMGRRENAQDLDLNRDFMKLEAPESQALVKLIDQVKPKVFVDLHTTNGSLHRYSLTYDIPHNPATAPQIRDYMRNKMMPDITQKMENRGQQTFYYGNFNGNQTQWSSYGHEPRFSTEYAGLRGCLAILSEAYSYIGYRERIKVSKDFMEAILDYATENHDEIQETIDNAENEWIQLTDRTPDRVRLSLSARATPFAEKFNIKGFKDDQPFDYPCEFVGNYISTRSTAMPFAYLIPRAESRVIQRLLKHGILVEELGRELTIEFEVDTFDEVSQRPNSFQKHRNRIVKTSRQLARRSAPIGDFIVRTGQPLGRLAAYLLESESDDGFVFWNFFDNHTRVGNEYPVLRISDPIDLVKQPRKDVPRIGELSIDSIDGPSSLIGDQALPKWVGNSNPVTYAMDQREILLDAATASFAQRPVRPYDANVVTRLLIDQGVAQQDVAALLSSPLVANNRAHVVFSNAQRAYLYNLPRPNEADRAGAELDPLIRLGRQPANDSQNANRALASDQRQSEVASKTAASEPGSEFRPCELFEFNSSDNTLAYVTTGGFHLLDLATGKEQIVAVPTKDHLLGKLDWIYQEELYGRGNFKGFWWNPVGDRVAVLSLDQAQVPQFLVTDHLTVAGSGELTRYPKAGDPLPKVRLAVIDSSNPQRSQWVDLSQYGDEDLLIVRATWSSSGEVLLLQIQNREQTWLDLIATDRDGKNQRLIFRDQTPAWIKSPGDPLFVSDDQFLWLSPRDGIRRIYRYDLQGKLIDTLTKQDWEVRELLGVCPKQEFCYFTGSEDPKQMHGYRLDLKSGEQKKLTGKPGTHQLKFSADYSLFLDHFSTVTQPVATFVVDAEGNVLRELAANSDDRLDYLGIEPPEFVSIPLADGAKLDGMVIKPRNFSPYTRFPVLVHIYAGPQTPRVRDRFEGKWYLWHQLLAQRGYVVLVVDNRSASYRNTRDVWEIHKQMGQQEIADIEAAVDWLKLQSWTQRDRIGLWGWSYGGYMTLYAMTHSKSFKVGISGAPVTDWNNYDAIYTERYMGLPSKNQAGYNTASVLKRADQLQGKLLLIHGTMDDNVHLNNSMQFVKELQDAGKSFELMVYPGNRHSILQPTQMRHLRELMTNFILTNL